MQSEPEANSNIDSSKRKSSEDISYPNVRRGIFLAFLGAACWGFSGTCVSWLTTNTTVSVEMLAQMRLIIAGSIFLIVAIVRYRTQLKLLFSRRDLILLLILYSIVGVVLLQISYMSAIKYTNPGTALLLQEICVALVLIYTCIKDRRAPRKLEILALALAFIGIFFIATQGDPFTLNINPIGLAWGIIAGIAMAGYNVIPVRLIEECGAVVTNGVAMIIGAIAMAPFVRPWESGIQFSVEAWFVFAGVVAVGTMLAYVVYLKGVADAGAVRASLMGVFEPVSGAVIAALWLGIMLTPWDLLGGAAIISMMIIVALQARSDS